MRNTPKRVQEIRRFLSELASIQSIEDLNPAKMAIDPTDFKEACVKLEQFFKKISKFLTIVGKVDLVNSIDSILSEDKGIETIILNNNSQIESRQKLLFDISRISTLLSFAELNLRLPSITFDTNCFIHFANKGSQQSQVFDDMGTLITAAATGRISAVVTTRVESDLESDPNAERSLNQIKKLQCLPVIPSPVRLGVSKLGKDYLASEECNEMESKIRTILFPKLSKEDKRYKNKICDIDHLLTHWMAMRDYFVTEDGDDMLNRKDDLKNIGIEVMNVNDCLLQLLKWA